MLLKLTFYRNNKTTLVNSLAIKSIYSVYNKVTDDYTTKIEFLDGTFINVEESLEEIYHLQSESIPEKKTNLRFTHIDDYVEEIPIRR
jgi:hypothetical protein